MKNKYFKLSNNVKLSDYRLFVDDCHLFDCNEDSVLLIKIFIELSNDIITFTEKEVYHRLVEEKKINDYKKDIRLIRNIISYLIDCRILFEVDEKVK